MEAGLAVQCPLGLCGQQCQVAVVLPRFEAEFVLQPEQFAECLVDVESELIYAAAPDVLCVADIDGGRGIVAESRHVVAVVGLIADAKAKRGLATGKHHIVR